MMRESTSFNCIDYGDAMWLEDRYHRFGGTYYLHLQDGIRLQAVSDLCNFKLIQL